jgi:hypothetical protein
VRLRRRVLLRLRPAVVVPVVGVILALVAVAVAGPVAAVSDTLAVAVVLMALAVTVVPLMLLGLVLVVAGPCGDAYAGCGGDPAAVRRASRAQVVGTRGGTGGRRGGDARARRRSRGRCGRRAAGRSRRRLGWRERGGDDGRDLAAARGRSGDGFLRRGLVEETRRGQNEADRDYHGQQAERRCGYARHTTPHMCPIGASAPSLNLSGGDRTSRPAGDYFLHGEGVRRRLRNPAVSPVASVAGGP